MRAWPSNARTCSRSWCCSNTSIHCCPPLVALFNCEWRAARRLGGRRVAGTARYHQPLVALRCRRGDLRRRRRSVGFPHRRASDGDHHGGPPFSRGALVAEDCSPSMARAVWPSPARTLPGNAARLLTDYRRRTGNRATRTSLTRQKHSSSIAPASRISFWVCSRGSCTYTMARSPSCAWPFTSATR